MTKLTYGEQLKHPNWQRVRLERLSASGWKCGGCGSTETTLHVHHKRYVKGRMAWEYEPDELQVLCEGCHAQHHEYADLLARVLLAFELDSVFPEELTAGVIAGFAAAAGRLDEDLAAEVRERCPVFFEFGVMAGALGGNRMVEVLSANAKPLSELVSAAVEKWRQTPKDE